jgi:hypothetical protein
MNRSRKKLGLIPIFSRDTAFPKAPQTLLLNLNKLLLQQLPLSE